MGDEWGSVRRARRWGVAAVVGLVAGSGVLIAVPATPVSAAGEQVFDSGEPDPVDRVAQERDVTSIAPARLLESRSGPTDATVDGESEGIGRVAAGSVTELRVTGRGGVPGSGVDAVVLNVTAVGPAGPGFLTVFPCGTSLPLASNVNYLPGQVVPNAVLAKVGAGGKVCIYTLAATDLVVDVNGWVGAGAGTTSIAPARLLESRSGPTDATVDGESEGIGRVAAGSVTELRVTGRGGVPGSGVDAVVLNVTAVGPAGPGFLTVFPCGTSLPLASNVNYLPGQVVPNAVLAKVGAGGKVCIYTLAATDLVVDVNGYAASGSGTTSIQPSRLLETRSGPTDRTADGAFEGIGRVAAGSVTRFEVAGRGGVPPTGVGAAMLNVTAVGPSAPGFLTVFPCGDDLPLASNVNYLPGEVVPNAVLAKIGDGGDVCIYSLAETDVVVDVNGWYELPPNQPDSNVTVLDSDEVVFVSSTESLTQLGSPVLVNAEGPSDTPPEVVELETSAPLEEGDLIVVEKPSGEPFYGRVDQAEDTSVRAEQVALADVVPSMDVSIEVDTDTKTVTKNEGGEAVEQVEVGDDQPAPDEGTKKTTNRPCEVGSDITFEALAQAQPGNFVFDMSFDKLKLDSARIGYNPFVEAEISVTATVGVECTVSYPLFEKQLPSIKFFIGPVPVLITQELSVAFEGKVEANVSGTKGFSARADAFIGVVYENGQWDRQSEVDLIAEQTSEANLDISITMSMPKVSYTAKTYGIVGFEATIAPTLQLLSQPLKNKFLRLTFSVDAEASMVVELDLKLTELRFAFTFARVTVFGPIEIWSLSKADTPCKDYTDSLPRSECEALVAIYEDNGGSAWSSKGAWGTDSDPCGGTWTGVTCDADGVTGLDLTSKGLIGPLPSALGDLTRLEDLTLVNNSITGVPGEIGDLDELSVLDLRSNDLESVPDSIGGLESLTELWLGSNSLEGFPSGLADLPALDVLDVSGNQLTWLNSSVGRMSSLTYLDVSQNELTAIPLDVYDLSNLETLDVSYNDIGGLPSDVGQLSELENLVASEIGMTALTDGVRVLTKLELLKVESNDLTTLPSGVSNMKLLKAIYINHNDFATVPSAITNLPVLDRLYMGNNPWSGDQTSQLRSIRDNSPLLAVVTMGPNGCPTVTDASVASWIDGWDASWDAGC